MNTDLILNLYSRIKQAFGTSNAAEIARKLGIERQSVYKWRDGKNPPEIERLIKIAEVTNSSLDWLLTGEGPRERVYLKNVQETAFDLEELRRQAVKEFLMAQLVQVSNSSMSKMKKKIG